VRKSIKKRLFRIFLNFVLILLCIPFALTFLFRDQMVQTLSARMLTAFLSVQVQNDFRINTIDVDIKKGITINGIVVLDHHQNTMIRVDKLSAIPVLSNFGLLGLRFSNINLDGVEFRYRTYAEEKSANLDVFIGNFSSGDTTTKSNQRSGVFKLRTAKLNLTNGLFQFFDGNSNYENGDGMDYANIIFDSINLSAQKFRLIGDSINVMIDSLSTVERSGMKIKKLQTHFSIANSGLRADDLKLKMDNSNLSLDLEFKTTSYKTFASFIDSVVISADIRPSSVQMSDIRYFSETMDKMRNEIDISGKVNGTISRLKGRGLIIDYGTVTHFEGNAKIAGLPDFFTSKIELDIDEFQTSTCDLKNFKLPIDGQILDFRKELDCMHPIQISGTFKGSYYDFVTNLTLDKGPAHLLADIRYKEVEADTLFFTANLKGNDINFGKILQQQELLGNLNLDLAVRGYGNSFDDLQFSSNGLLFSFDLMNYRYSMISLNAHYFSDTIEADLRIGDKHLMMSAIGKLTFEESPYLAFEANIRRADLDNIKLWEDRDLRVQTIASVKLKGFDLSSMTADISLTNSKLMFGEEFYTLDEFHLEKNTSEEGLNSLKVNSGIVDLDMSGKYDIVRFPEQLAALLNTYFDAFPQSDTAGLAQGEYANLNVELKKSNLLEEQFLEGLELYPPLTIESSVDFSKKDIRMEMKHDKLAYQGIMFHENAVKLFTDNNRVNLDFKSNEVIVKDTTEDDKSMLGIDDLHFTGAAGFNLFNYGLYWTNADSINQNSGEIEGYVQTDETSSRLKMTSVNVYLDDTLWTVDNENMIVADSSGMHFKDLKIYGGTSEMNISGYLPQKNGDSLTVSFNQWNLSNFDFVTKLYNFDIDGIVEGDLNVSLLNDQPTVVSDVTINDLYLNEEYLGKASLINTWDDVNRSVYVKSQILRSGTSGEGEVFAIEGYFFPYRDEESLDLDIRFSRFKLKTIEPFVADFVSQIEGQTSGEIALKGTFEKPLLTGKMDMRRTGLMINYLNTKYSFSNEIRFTPTQVNFDKLVIYDTLGNFANVQGVLSHNYFQDPRFDVKITTDKLLFFNTTRKMNDLYYGTAITSGDITISGSPSNIKLDMDITTQKGTDVKLPLDYSIEISDKDYIVFVKHQDSLDMEKEELEGKEKIKEEELSYEIKLGMDITPNAKTTIFLPSDMGRIESEGRGNLKMMANSNGDLTLIGDYMLEDGLFHFSLGNLVSKRFDLVRGGRISWTGDPYSANINVKGLYRLKTSLSSLGIPVDTTSGVSTKVNVECYVILKNQLLNPDIRFEIKIPDLDPDQQRRVYAQLDTTNQAVMSQQMISLLVLGTFSMSNASNVSLSSSYYSVLSNQLSNMLSKISDDFDIGINYKPGDNVSQEEFEVALSTQLFDDRLVIDGHFGMTYDKAQSNASNIVGDVDIAYKLTEDGKWLLKAFNHSNINSWYNYSGYDKIAPYTQGVGIAFRKEFTNIKELFQRSRPKKAKSDQDQNEEATKNEDL